MDPEGTLMDQKRLFLAIAASIAILVVFQFLLPPAPRRCRTPPAAGAVAPAAGRGAAGVPAGAPGPARPPPAPAVPKKCRG